MSDTDNLVEYADPEIYDLENRDFEPDGPFFLALARRCGGPVLELGCGTGRITIPLAREGFAMTGLDITPGMLALARRKAGDLPIEWVEADARAFQLNKRFALIFESGSTFQHMHTRRDQEAMLARVREHLAPGGHFACGALFPQLDMLEDVKEEKEWYTYQNGAGQEVRVSGIEHYDPLSQIKTETAFRRWRDADGRDITRRVPLQLRYVFPQEMDALLHYNGFTVVERWGDLDFSPLTAQSRSMLYLVQATTPE